MMVLPEFDLMRPQSLFEALRALKENPAALPVAGGTDLLVSMKHGLFDPSHLVELKGIEELRRKDITDNGARLGACLRLSDLRDDPAIRQRYPALSEAAGVVASPPLQNRGTLGGNICLDTRCRYYNQSAFWRKSLGYCLKRQGNICRAAPASKRCYASFSSDTVPALIALRARVRTARWEDGIVRERELALEDFFVEDGIKRNALTPGELVIGVMVPPADDYRSGYRKYRQRASIDYPLVSIAVALRLVGERMHGVRVVVGALASAPVIAQETMAVLEGSLPTSDILDRAADLVTKGTKPVRNQAGTPAHRRHTARVICRRLLGDLTDGP